MGRVGTRSGKGCCNEEGGAPYPTIPTANPCPYALRSRSSQPAYALRPWKRQLFKPAPPRASRRRRAVLVSSSVRGRKRQQPLQTEEEEDDDDDDEERIVPKEEVEAYLARRAGETLQLAFDYYKREVGPQPQLIKIMAASDEMNCLGLVTHIQFQVEILNPEPRPATVYAQIHIGSFSADSKMHASRVFTLESPLLKDPHFKLDATSGWIDYPFDCPVCGFDALDALKSKDFLRRLELVCPE